MSDVNTVSLTGRLTRDPEAIADEKGVRFSIASNRSYRRQGADEWTEEAVFVSCTAWNGLAKRIRTKLSKGSFVALQGRLELNTWEADGEKRQQLRVVVLELTSPDFFRRSDEPPAADEQLPMEATA